MSNEIDREVTNLSNRKLWDLLRLSKAVEMDDDFIEEVESELGRRNCLDEDNQWFFPTPLTTH